MTLRLKASVVFLFGCLFTIANAARWPQAALSFVCSKNNIFFINTCKKLYIYDHVSHTREKFFYKALTVGCDAKAIMFDGKKTRYYDVNISSDDYCVNVNNFYSCKAVHCTVSDSCFEGRLIFLISDYKKIMQKKLMQKLFACEATANSWFVMVDAVQSDLENAFAIIAEKRSMVVRVLLHEASNSGNATWKFSSPDGITISFVGEGSTKKIFCSQEITVMAKNGVLFCNGYKITHSVRLEPLCGYGECNGVSYDGYFSCIAYKDSFLCINHVDVEDYIVAVLRTESWPGWPLEVNKVFAIACRSYVACKANEAKRATRPFHVKNTNAHQTYRGRHNVSVLKKAVEQTRGVVLCFNQKPILAMFDSCCGGIIPAHIEDFDFKKVPYLAREYACTFCKTCSLYSWEVSYEHHVFNQLINEYKKELQVLRDISVTKKDGAGLVSEVFLKGRRSPVIVSGKKMYSLLKDVKSFYFDVHKKEKHIVFFGRGFGHHIGLCQWGARQMVKEGWDYKSILQFYYPRTQFMKMV
jgi:stage II sporulation protein D